MSFSLRTPTSRWRQIQKENFTQVRDLADFLELSEENRAQLLNAPKFILNLPHRLASKIAKNDINDPLFRQFVPLIAEQEKKEGFVTDPVCDTDFRKEKKLLHKYHGRALLLPTSACAMHCRYCFRQNFPYETGTSDLTRELAYLKKHTDLREVILSGGDPLSLNDAALMQYLHAIDEIPHIRRIRFHTRFPIGIPERIDNSFLELLSGCQKQIYFVIHCNHARELDEDILSALRKVGQLGIPLLNSSVLLKGVNDNEETLLQLCETLIDAGIMPYYLNLLDPVEGSAHFDVPAARGRELLQYVQERLSGYGVPHLVREEPGASSKTRNLSF
ncbi:MAG: KamA family radical SAM protein [Verrucomicrobiota bacterium]|nr:KamA family radical SAM protein [Verrucomicrobiota bacterium]